MPHYDFKTLSPIDFEILVRDLLQKELKIRLENFKPGKDKGIDLRCSWDSHNALIVQCKHFANSSFSDLYSHLRREELGKIRALNPKRYILATSLGLTPQQKDKVLEVANPFIQHTGDIFGQGDLNNLLSHFPEVERLHFKLWFGSTTVLEQMLLTRMRNFSRELVEQIQRDAMRYVQNSSFSDALAILDNYNYCIIAGIPGIGKTILAEMLLLHYMQLGFEVVKIESDIGEARQIDYRRERRIFYYDDFLGQASSGDKLNKNEEQSLLDFIAAVSESRVSKIVLTTREYILNQARAIYEKLNRARFDGQTCIVDLAKYTRRIRAQILFNHLYFSKLLRAHKEALLRAKSYLQIIDHPNYSPRIISLMTDPSRVQNLSPDGYRAKFLDTLHNPAEIWQHAFENQLSQAARNLIVVLTSMPTEVFLEDVQRAFQAYTEHYLDLFGGTSQPNEFMRALKELDGNFIACDRQPKDTLVKFHNPSVRDFMQSYLRMSQAEITLLLNSSCYFDQVLWLWNCSDDDDNHMFRPLLERVQTQFLLALRRNLHSSNCATTNYQSPSGRFYRHVEPVSFVDRVSFIASVAATLKSSSVLALFSDALGELQQKINAKEVEGDALVSLLGEMFALKLISVSTHSSLFASAKESLLTRLFSPQDFVCVTEAAEKFPELLSNEDLGHVKQEFERVLSEDSDVEDPDRAREEFAAVKETGKRFKVDVKEKLEELDRRIADLEESAPHEPDDDYRPSGRESDGCSDAEIDSMFRSV
jgi:hypothetical protein